MSNPLDRNPEREAIRQALPRIFPEPLNTQRRLLEQLLEGPKSTDELSVFLESAHYKAGPDFVRKEIANARKFIDAFHMGPDGFSERLKMHIPNLAQKGDRYCLTVVPNRPPRNAGGFWAAHLANKKPTRIVTGRPEFLHGKETGLLLRHEFFNGMSAEMLRLLRTSETDLFDGEMRTVQPFMAISDVRAMLSVFSYLDSWRRDHNHLPPEILGPDGDEATSDANIVALGTPFDNRRIMEVEEEALSEERYGRGSLYKASGGMGFQKKMPNGEYRVWVHRRWSESHCETLISASTSEVLAPVCNFLTSDTEMNAVICDLWSKKPWEGFPIEFKIQIRVKMSEDGVTARRIRVQQYASMDDWYLDEHGQYLRIPKYEIREGHLGIRPIAVRSSREPDHNDVTTREVLH